MTNRIKLVTAEQNRHVRAYFENEKGQRLPLPEVSLSRFTQGGRWTVNYTQDIDGLDVESAAKVYELFQAALNRVKEIDPQWNAKPEMVES